MICCYSLFIALWQDIRNAGIYSLIFRWFLRLGYLKGHENTRSAQTKIEKAARIPPFVANITLIAVSKQQPETRIEAILVRIRIFGENRAGSPNAVESSPSVYLTRICILSPVTIE